MKQERKQIFISMGTPYTEPQTQFRDALVSVIREQQLEVRIINVTDYPVGNPLPKIKEVLAECDGAIVVAYERTYFDMGLEKRQSSVLKRSLGQTRYTTAWNQIEAAMGYALGLPILVLKETALLQEGLLEEKYDWYVQDLEISAAALASGESRVRVAQWCQDIRDGKLHRPTLQTLDPNVTPMEVIRVLSFRVWIAILTGTVTVLGAVFKLGLWVGNH